MNSKIEKILGKAGLKKTNPRMEILKVLINEARPITPEYITEQTDIKNLNKTTVYRNLDAFVNAGVVHRAFFEDRSWHYELGDNCTSEQCHPHFTCNNCNQTFCLTQANLPKINRINNFLIQHQHTQFKGICPSCQ